MATSILRSTRASPSAWASIASRCCATAFPTFARSLPTISGSWRDSNDSNSMRVPMSWLRDYVDFDLPPERLAERLTMLGMEVGSIDKIGADWTAVVIGELIEVGPHPNADRIQLTKVRVSDTDAPLQIVCGAHNIAAGQRVPVALPGAVLPGDRRIGVSTIQGTESQGM